jgi:WD40 repeat protein
LENKVSVFKIDADKAVPTKEFPVSKEPLLNVLALEEQDIFIAAGSGHQCNFFIHSLGGASIKTLKSDVTEATSIKIDRLRARSVYFSSSTDIRVFAPQLTSKREFKDYTREHIMCGHNNGVVSGCFNSKGTEFFSLSLDRTLKRWDTGCEGFQGNHITCLNTWPIDQSLITSESLIEWVGSTGEGKMK